MSIATGLLETLCVLAGIGALAFVVIWCVISWAVAGIAQIVDDDAEYRD